MVNFKFVDSFELIIVITGSIHIKTHNPCRIHAAMNLKKLFFISSKRKSFPERLILRNKKELSLTAQQPTKNKGISLEKEEKLLFEIKL